MKMNLDKVLKREIKLDCSLHKMYQKVMISHMEATDKYKVKKEIGRTVGMID